MPIANVPDRHSPRLMSAAETTVGGAFALPPRTRVLLFGRAGQVGGALARRLAATCALTALDRSGCDLADSAAVRAAILAQRPDVVINAAAWTAVDRAEAEPEAAHRINAQAPGTMAAAAREIGALLVHYSTDYVFDGRKRTPWTEDDSPAPLGVYGRSKLAGERAVQQAGGAHLILRTSWVYGLTGHNFLRTMLRLAAERDELAVVDDQIGAPTWSEAIAQATVQAIGAWLAEPDRRAQREGLFHLSAAGQTSWCGFARAIFELAPDLPRRPRVRAIGTEQYPLPAPRPAWSVLDGSRLEAAFGIRMAGWREALQDCLDSAPRMR